MRNGSAILERKKKGERGGGKTLLASDDSDALNFLSVGREHFNPHLEGEWQDLLRVPECWGRTFSSAVLCTVDLISFHLPLILETTLLSQMTEMQPAIHSLNSHYLEGEEYVCRLLC